MIKKNRPIELTTLGRAAVDLYAEQIGKTLEDASSFAKYVGGCPANIAIGASRLGLKTAIITGVGDEAMGRYVTQTLNNEKVDTRWVAVKEGHLTGLVLLGVCPPNHFPLIFYRENCADMQLDENDITPEIFQQTNALLITGTHCSTPSTLAATKKAARLARENGCELILDIDYRPVLWGTASHGEGEERYAHDQLAQERLSQLLPLCTLIVGTEEELMVAAGEREINQALKTIRSKTTGIIVQKRGEQGCAVYPADLDQPITSPPFEVEVLNVLGAGDAFLSGFLRGYLRDEPFERCAELGNANGAVVVTRHGCSPAMPTWEEINQFIHERQTIGSAS